LQEKACLRKASAEGTTFFCTFSYFLSAREFVFIFECGTEGVDCKNVCKQLNTIKCGPFSMTLCVAQSPEACEAPTADFLISAHIKYKKKMIKKVTVGFS
jgi:hypothetical protein